MRNSIGIILFTVLPHFVQAQLGSGSFVDEVSIFRETNAPLLFLSPETSTESIKGLVLSAEFESNDPTKPQGMFSLRGGEGRYQWDTGQYGGLMGFNYDGELKLTKGSNTIVLSPANALVSVNGQNLVTTGWIQTWTENPISFDRISIGGGSAAASGSFASGPDTVASGVNSTAFGMKTTAQGLNQTVIGQYNLPLGNPNAMTAGSPLFIIGNGTGENDRKNAVVVNSDGDVAISGRVTSGPSSGAYASHGTALGVNVHAHSRAAVAMGENSHASGMQSFAVGASNVAQEQISVALGGWTRADAYGSTSLGAGTYAGGHASLVAGEQSIASGHRSVAIGHGSEALGDSSQAFGYAKAVGHSSTAVGFMTQATGYAQTAVGSFNELAPNARFVVGIGEDPDGAGEQAPKLKNALEVNADGSTHARVLRVERSGDLSMGDFMAGPRPFPTPAP